MGAAQDGVRQIVDNDGFGWGTDAEELRRFFLEYEATIGFSSTFSAMLAAQAGVAMGSGPPANWDPYAQIVHKLSEAKAVYRTLKRMDDAGDRASVVVLWRLYGPWNEHNLRNDYGKDQVAKWAVRLAEYTDAAAEARDALVLQKSTMREEQTARLVAKSQRETLAELETLFWSEARRIAVLETRLDGPNADRARNRIAAGRELMGQIVETLKYDGTLRARLGAIESTDREITIADALRDMLEPPARDKGKAAREAWRVSRDAFVTAVRLEANRMRRHAHEAYRAAKRGSS